MQTTADCMPALDHLDIVLNVGHKTLRTLISKLERAAKWDCWIYERLNFIYIYNLLKNSKY